MAQRSIVIGRFTLQGERQLLCGGAPVALGVKPLKLLSALVEMPGEVVTKDELMARVWPGLIVEENTLQAQISTLRKALGEEARWIATVPGRGYRFAGPPVVGAEAAPLSPPGIGRRLTLAIGLCLVALLIGGVALDYRGAGANRAEAPRRYLVLPFANRTGDPRNDDLAERLTDETAARLAARSWDASVLAHNEAYAFKDRAVDEALLGRQLGLDYIIEGVVQPAEAGVEVVGTLIDGRSGTHLATSRAGGAPDETGAGRRRLAAALTDQLRASVGRDARRRFAATDSAADSPRDLLDRAALALQDEPVAEGWVQPLALIDRALVLQPHDPHALLLSGLARTGLVGELVYRNPAERAALLARAEQALDEAARLEPNRPDIHFALGNLRSTQGRHDAARAEFERVLDLDAADQTAAGALAMEELYDGHPERTLHLLDQARPVGIGALYLFHGTRAQALLHRGEDAAALDALRHAIAIDASDPWAWPYLVGLLQLTGRTDELPAAMAQLETLSPGLTIARLRALDAQASPFYRAQQERLYAALLAAGMPEGENATAGIDGAGVYRP